jgi:hypothetical protein
MFNPKLFAALSVGLIAAACAGPYDRQASMSSSVASTPTASERNCLDYGFASGTPAFDRCVRNESSARAAGRANHDYAEARLSEDARQACYSYGLGRGTQRYDNCVTREIDARRYREQYSQTPLPPRANAADYNPVPSPTPYVGTRTATTGIEAFRDEYGFRYDAQGDRIDRNGRIISPQSTTP